MKENDFDDRLKSFGFASEGSKRETADEIRKFTTKMGNTKQIKNKGAFYMGIVEEKVQRVLEEKAAKDSMEEKEREREKENLR